MFESRSLCEILISPRSSVGLEQLPYKQLVAGSNPVGCDEILFRFVCFIFFGKEKILLLTSFMKSTSGRRVFQSAVKKDS